MVAHKTTRLFPTIRLARALALIAALMLATGTSARAAVLSIEPSASASKPVLGIACIVGAVGAATLAVFGGFMTLVTGHTGVLEVSKPLIGVMMGGCVAGVAREITQQALAK